MIARRISQIIGALLALSSGALADEFGGPDRAKREWPDSPDKYFLHHLVRPDNDQHPDREDSVRSCCDAGDAVPTQFRVEPGSGGPYPEDRWYAWLSDQWVAIPPDKIVPDYAPTGRAYLFVIEVPIETPFEFDVRPGMIQVIACFVRPRGGL